MTNRKTGTPLMRLYNKLAANSTQWRDMCAWNVVLVSWIEKKKTKNVLNMYPPPL